MIEDIGRILKGAFFIIAALGVFGLGVSAGYFGVGDAGSVGITGAATTEKASCPTYECKLNEDKCELVKTGELVKK